MFGKKPEHLKKSRGGWIKRLLSALAMLLLVVLGGVFFMLYGPDTQLRDLYVTTMLQTSALKFMATAFLPPAVISQIMEDNKVIPAAAVSDPSKLKMTRPAGASPAPAPSNSPTPPMTSKKPDSSPLPTPTPAPVPKLFSDLPNASSLTDGMEGIQLLNIEYNKSHGYMLVVTDPSRVVVGVTDQLGKRGQRLHEMCQSLGAVAGINGGAFEDPGGHGNGSTPLGCLVSHGEIVTFDGDRDNTVEIIGFNRDDALVIGRYTRQKLEDDGIRDAVSFGPMLIVDGQPSTVKGNGGGGLQPRTAIGQRQDGAVLLLVMDGRQIKSPGVTYKQMMEILLEYGAYNAANLDGGSSATIVVNGEILNHPCGPAGARYLPTAFVVMPQ